MKKWIAMLMAVLMLLSLCACGAAPSAAPESNASAKNEDAPAQEAAPVSEEESKNLKIALLFYEMCEATNISERRIQELAAEKGIDIVESNAQWDASVQLSQVEDAISAGVDAIILFPSDSDAMVAALALCEEADMPLVCATNSLNTDQPYYYVGAAEEPAGYMEAKALAEALNGEGDIVILQCILGTGYEVGRTEGYNKVLAEYPGLHVLDAQPANGQRDVSIELMENWIEAYGDEIDGVLAQCDEMSIGAIIALQNAGMLENVKVVGIDGTSNGLTEVRDGRMLMTCMQDLSYVGETALDYALQLINGETPSPEKDIIDMVAIDSSNVDEYLFNLYGIK